MKKFKMNQFIITQISSIGIWLVEAKEQYDVAMLFFRAQEYYESSNPAFFRRTFYLEDYMRWYSLELSEDKSFTYAQDWEGFNIPQDIIEEYLECEPKDTPTTYDGLFRKIVERIKSQQEGKFYLIGAKRGDESTIDHEISHALWSLDPEYKERSRALFGEISRKDANKLRSAFHSMGYSKSVVEDEMVAYLSTGLIKKLVQFDYLRWPFMQNFYTTKSKLIK